MHGQRSIKAVFSCARLTEALGLVLVMVGLEWDGMQVKDVPPVFYFRAGELVGCWGVCGGVGG